MPKKLTFVAAFALLCVSAAGYSAAMQTSNQPPKTEVSQTKRLIYVVRHGSAKELADLLNTHFGADAEFLVSEEGGDNLLIINSKTATYKEVLKALQNLDPRPQTVALEILILDAPQALKERGKAALIGGFGGEELFGSKKASAAKLEPGGVIEKNLSGPIDRVLANINELQGQGLLSVRYHFELSAVEGKATKSLVGNTHSYVVGGVSITGKDGKRQTVFTRVNKYLKTQVNARPSIAADGSLTIELALEDQRAIPSVEGIPIAKDEAGRDIPAREFPTLRFKSQLHLHPGQAVLAEDAKIKTVTIETRTLVVVCAKLAP